MGAKGRVEKSTIVGARIFVVSKARLTDCAKALTVERAKAIAEPGLDRRRSIRNFAYYLSSSGLG